MERKPSLNLILETFERERDRQLSHFDALDTKAGVILGFAGVIAAIAYGTSALAGTIALTVASLAALVAITAFWPRRLPAIEPRTLRDYLLAEDRITRLVLVDTYLGMIDEARGLLGLKSRRLKAAMSLLAAAGLVAVIGEIVR